VAETRQNQTEKRSDYNSAGHAVFHDTLLPDCKKNKTGSLISGCLFCIFEYNLLVFYNLQNSRPDAAIVQREK
jgi:hypothetical protein